MTLSYPTTATHRLCDARQAMLRSMGLQAAAGAAAAQRAIYCSRTLNLRSIQARTSLWVKSRVNPDSIPSQARSWVHMLAQFLLGIPCCN